MSNLAGYALEGGDPRRPSVVQIGDKQVDLSAASGATSRRLHDSSVTFEEYLYFARVSRADERYEELNPDYKIFGVTLKRNSDGSKSAAQHIAEVMGGQVIVPDGTAAAAAAGTAGDSSDGVQAAPAEKAPMSDPEKTASNDSNRLAQYGVSDDEYLLASRAIRTAGWSAIFFLITTDVLGPFVLPTAVAFLGYGPSVVLYTIFGVLAGYGGLLLWKLFLNLDSDRYPLRTYSDIPYRLFGAWARHICSFLQFIQLFLNVGIIILQNGLSLEQIVVGSGSSFCFVILAFFWAIAGAVIGQIRTLKNISAIGFISVFLNIFTIFMIVGVVVNSEPNYDDAAQTNGPLLGFDANTPHKVITTAGAPAGTDFNVQVSGLELAVFAYGGATIFVELMAEMRRPFDFWKGMVTAQLLIYVLYLFFGLFVYSYQGQYSINPAYQSISPYAWQTTGNAIQLVTSLIAAILYGNVGLKVTYNAIFRDLFKLPDLGTRTGKILWVGLIPIYWALAFVVGAAIPQITSLIGVVAAVAILQFSYTFPPLFHLGMSIRKNAMLPGDGFNPVTGQTIRQDRGFKRYLRGYKKNWILNSWHLIFCLGSAVTAVLGIYSAILAIEAAFAGSSATSFSCHSSYNP